MTRREKIGQLFMLGFSGTSVSAELAGLLAEYRPGGVIVFARNLQSPEQIAHSPLLIAIDQEGGRVSRLPKEFTIFPACALLGQCGSAELAYDVAAGTAKELRAVGINMNMAPVLDVDTNPRNPIIGDRAFSGNAEQVAEMGLATMAGLHDHKVLACGKHFPGHGDTSADSHKELPIVTASVERLREVELRPFRHAIDHGLATIMTAHVSYPHLDAHYPATLSSTILTKLLREELGFRGLIITDDLEMHAIIDHYGMGEAAVQAFTAGADMLLICKEYDRAVAAMEALYLAASDGVLSEVRIEASLRRIAQVKERFLFPYTPVDPQTAKQVVGSPAHQALLETVRRGGRSPNPAHS
jgi:beta-N-acetylhexosaminidase